MLPFRVIYSENPDVVPLHKAKEREMNEKPRSTGTTNLTSLTNPASSTGTTSTTSSTDPIKTSNTGNPPYQKEWANPTPAGLVALAVACFCFFAMLTNSVEKTALPLIGCWLLGGFVIQVVVGLLDLKSGNHSGGNTFLFFSAFFMLVGGLEMFVKYHYMTTGVALDTRIDGYAWLALTLVVYLWTPAFLKSFSLLSLVVLALDVALPFITLIDLKILPAEFSVVLAYALLAAALFAIYLGAAQVVNTAYGRKIYPVIEKKK